VVFDVGEALRVPAMTIESGPAAGVIAAAIAGKELGVPNLISFDMGGTTAKASLIANGEIAVTAEYEVGGAGHSKRWLHGTGHPIRVPVIDLAEVSAGGPMRLWLELPDGAVQRLNSKGSFRVPAGARLVMEAPGSGGYGPPPARDDALVHEDYADGYVTPRAVSRDDFVKHRM
jgi:N-methylhydantoinase A